MNETAQVEQRITSVQQDIDTEMPCLGELDVRLEELNRFVRGQTNRIERDMAVLDEFDRAMGMADAPPEQNTR